MTDLITRHRDDPETLERLFRESPEVFRRHLPEALAACPDHLLLRAWQARLAPDPSSPPTGRPFEIAFVLLLVLVGSVLAKWPELSGTNANWYYARLTPFAVFVPLCAYFLVRHQAPRRAWLMVGGVLAASVLYLSFFPGHSNTDTFKLVTYHLPFFLWALLGYAYSAKSWGDTGLRLGFLKYNGEAFAYGTLILLGGMVLTAITFALFHAIGLNIEEGYFQTVVIFGSVGAPIVATSLATRGLNPKIAPTLARLFGPLFLLTLLAYLATMLGLGKSPFMDRDFLTIFNVMLLGVLALTVFSVIERPQADTPGFSDTVNVSMIGVALLLNAIALSAIVFRLTSFGLTPNRVAVLGANLLVFAHLATLTAPYLKWLRGKGPVQAVESAIARFLPFYSVWTAFVVFLYPLLWRFQ